MRGLSAALLLSAASSGSAVLVRQAPLAFDLATLESGESLEDASLSTVFQHLRSRFNTSKEWVGLTAEGMVDNFFKQTGSEDALLNLARNFPSMASNGTEKLQQAMELAQRRMQANPGASVRQLALLSLEAFEETGVKEELKRLATYPFPGDNGVFAYSLDGIQAGITMQSFFPIPNGPTGTGWAFDYFMVWNRDIGESRPCVSFRIAVADEWSHPFGQFTHSLFAGQASWGSVIDGRNEWTWGVTGGPRLGGQWAGLNAITGEASYSIDKLRRSNGWKSMLIPDNWKVVACTHNSRACLDPTDLMVALTLFGEMTICHQPLPP